LNIKVVFFLFVVVFQNEFLSFFLSLLKVVGFEVNSLMFARQALCHLNHRPSPFVLVIFYTFCLGLAWNHTPALVELVLQTCTTIPDCICKMGSCKPLVKLALKYSPVAGITQSNVIFLMLLLKSRINETDVQS
jgi:hypothetical protein